MRSDILPVIQVASLGHALLGFVNGEYIGNYDNNLEPNFFFYSHEKYIPYLVTFN